LTLTDSICRLSSGSYIEPPRARNNSDITILRKRGMNNHLSIGREAIAIANAISAAAGPAGQQSPSAVARSTLCAAECGIEAGGQKLARK
jgi:hypothetical protein